MRLTTKGRFAATAMIDLALHAKEGPITLNAISERQNISLSYLEQLFSKLRKAELVKSIRGPGGGYILAKSIEEINFAQIIIAAEDKLDATQCKNHGNCNHGISCLSHNIWASLNEIVDNFLSQITLKQIVYQQQNKDAKIISLASTIENKRTQS